MSKRLAESVREGLAVDAELDPDFYNPGTHTANIGAYTVDAEINVVACKDDDGIETRAMMAANRLRELVAPAADGFRFGVVKYHCDRLGTHGLLDFGYLWRQGEEIRTMPACRGLWG